jgi:hypothetical protein
MKPYKIGALIIIAGLAFVISGCTNRSLNNIEKMYPGQDLPIEQIAALYNRSADSDLKVTAIDGKEFGLFDFKFTFELAPGPHEVVVKNRKIGFEIGLSFNAKPNYDYYLGEIIYHEDGDDIYSSPYIKLSMDESNKNAIECRSKLSIKKITNLGNIIWKPFVLENGPRRISGHVIDWENKGIARELNDMNIQYFNQVINTIQRQEKAAFECMGENANNYFKGYTIRNFPLMK